LKQLQGQNLGADFEKIKQSDEDRDNEIMIPIESQQKDAISKGKPQREHNFTSNNFQQIPEDCPPPSQSSKSSKAPAQPS